MFYCEELLAKNEINWLLSELISVDFSQISPKLYGWLIAYNKSTKGIQEV